MTLFVAEGRTWVSHASTCFTKLCHTHAQARPPAPPSPRPFNPSVPPPRRTAPDNKKRASRSERAARRSCTGPTDTTPRPLPSTHPRPQQQRTSRSRAPQLAHARPHTRSTRTSSAPCRALPLHSNAAIAAVRPPPPDTPPSSNSFPGPFAGPPQAQQVHPHTPDVPAHRADSSAQWPATPRTQPGPHTDSCTHVWSLLHNSLQ